MTDAFWVAFRIPNMLRRLLSEGLLTVFFVPISTEYLQKKTKEEDLELAFNASINWAAFQLTGNAKESIVDRLIYKLQ
jgi:peptidoglycan biosynthesis protein MviN/MurJ (putative lipid II flippase)